MTIYCIYEIYRLQIYSDLFFFSNILMRNDDDVVNWKKKIENNDERIKNWKCLLLFDCCSKNNINNLIANNHSDVMWIVVK